MTEPTADAQQGFALERDGDALRLVEPSGQRWRVYDATFVAGQHRRTALGSGRATERLFIPPDPAAMRRLYRFRVGDSRALGIETVETQWRQAEYFRSERTDSNPQQPR